jgi:hypothetical protein
VRHYVKQSMLSVLLISTLIFSGCTKTVYVDRPVKVKIPVKCKVPSTDCTVGGSDPEVVVGLGKCIIDLKQSIKVCQ